VCVREREREKKKTEFSSETFVSIYQTARSHFPEKKVLRESFWTVIAVTK